MTYIMKYQKMKRNDNGEYIPARAYSTDEYGDLEEFLTGLVEMAQYRKRGYKYRLMEVVDSDDVYVRLDWQKSSPTE